MSLKPGPRNISIASLLRYRFPIMAIASILHRVSGFILFLLIPFMLWLLYQSVASLQSFEALSRGFDCIGVRFLIWVLLSALWYHLLAGIKHLLMDLGHLESKEGGKISASVVIILGVLGMILLGVWLW